VPCGMGDDLSTDIPGLEVANTEARVGITRQATYRMFPLESQIASRAHHAPDEFREHLLS
jgi:hypothetical protein